VRNRLAGRKLDRVANTSGGRNGVDAKGLGVLLFFLSSRWGVGTRKIVLVKLTLTRLVGTVGRCGRLLQLGIIAHGRLDGVGGQGARVRNGLTRGKLNRVGRALSSRNGVNSELIEVSHRCNWELAGQVLEAGSLLREARLILLGVDVSLLFERYLASKSGGGRLRMC
jgi:hypothetical protein